MPEDITESVIAYFRKKKLAIYYRTYFYDMIYPAFFLTIRSALSGFEPEQLLPAIEAIGELSAESAGARFYEFSSESGRIVNGEADAEEAEELAELEELPGADEARGADSEEPPEAVEDAAVSAVATEETVSDSDEEAALEELEELEEIMDAAEEAEALEELEELPDADAPDDAGAGADTRKGIS